MGQFKYTKENMSILKENNNHPVKSLCCISGVECTTSLGGNGCVKYLISTIDHYIKNTILSRYGPSIYII